MSFVLCLHYDISKDKGEDTTSASNNEHYVSGPELELYQK